MKPTVKQLKNGISVVLSPQEGAKSATILVYCRVGSRYETKEINGASHFIEHLMFKGTKRRPTAQDISRELDQYGADYNAYTSKDKTGYYVKSESAHLSNAIDLLYDMIFHSKYDPKEINRERGVIIEEINMYEDNPRMHIEDLLERVLFPSSTLGWEIIGPRKVIRKITPKQLREYRDAYYIPERLTITVAGDIPKDVMKQLGATFGRLRSPKRKRDAAYKPFCPPKSLKNALIVQEKKTEQTQLGLAFFGYPIGHEDEPTAKLLSVILGGYMSSRLFIQVRERRGLCYSVYASHDAVEDTGMFSIFAGLDRKRLNEAVHTIYGELDKVKKQGVTEEELRRAKDNLRGKIALAFEDSSFQAAWYGKQWMHEKKIQTPEERMKEIDRVTRTDIKRVANAIFNPACVAKSVIGPKGNRAALDKIFKWE